MSQTPAATTASSAGETSPGAYQPVQGGAESRSGETLLVEAYVILWVLFMGWLFLLWRTQARLHARIDELEKVLDRAEASGAKKGA